MQCLVAAGCVPDSHDSLPAKHDGAAVISRHIRGHFFVHSGRCIQTVIGLGKILQFSIVEERGPRGIKKNS
jgi:hypothetical protein